MSEQHNTNTSSMPELPSIGIVISGSDVLARKKTIESIEKQTYDNYEILINEDDSPCSFFNSLEKSHGAYCFVRAGDRFYELSVLTRAASRFSRDSLVRGIYFDCCIEGKDDSVNQVLLPPYDTETFANLLGMFPIFVTSSVCEEFPMDENLDSLYSHNLLLRISSKYMIIHDNSLGFALHKYENDLSSDIAYLTS
tara:strand:- start:391 stop:978 length:588 start_codon:yes stop_codon:yes gene_type:complete